MCEAVVEVGARFCSRCGVEVSGLPTGSARTPGRWYHNVWVLLFLILFVLGPFALPLIWKNPRLSQPAKLWLTAVALVYVLATVALIHRVITAVSSSLDAFNSTLTF